MIVMIIDVVISVIVIIVVSIVISSIVRVDVYCHSCHCDLHHNVY